MQTGIAVTLAIMVVGLFFFYPQFFPIGASNDGIVAGTTTDTSLESTTTETMDTTELKVIDVAVGTGDTVVAGDSITVNYVGKLTNGTVFDASANHGGPATFAIGVGQVIPGWDQGIVGMKVGGKRTLVIPPQLAYGENGVPGAIPGNATLVFEVELVSLKHAQ